MSEVQLTKTCRTCKISKLADEFNCCKSTADGRQSKCRACEGEYYRGNKGAISARVYKYKMVNRASIKCKSAAYHKANQETIRARKVSRYRANPAAVRKKHAAYLSTPEGKAKRKSSEAAYNKIPNVKAKRKAKQVAYKKANPEVIKAYVAKYCASPNGRAKRRLAVAKRRALEFGATIGDPKLIAAWDKTWRTEKSVPCHWCGKKFPGNKCHADHVLSLAKGGAHDVENLCISCPMCNMKKHDKLPEVFNATLEQPLLFW